MSMSKNKKWKNALLGSGLPLEYLVANKLEKLDIYVTGEYSFWRPNENRVNTEFSVDLLASRFFEQTEGKEDFWGELRFLVECKYNYPGVKWVFSPFPQEHELIIGFINTLQDFTVTRINRELLNSFDGIFNYCLKGIELHEDGVNPQSIIRGINQLRYGSVQLSKNFIADQVGSWHDSELLIAFLCPILITTAPLYVVKQDLLLEDFHSADNIEDVTRNVEAVIVNPDIGVELKKYIKAVELELRNSWPELDERLKNLSDILRNSNYDGYYMTDSFLLENALRRSSERILVVNYDAFEKIIQNIVHLVSSTKSTLRRYATLEYHKETHKAFIRPI